MAKTGFKFDMSQLEDFIDKVKERCEHPSPLMAEIGEILVSGTKKRMDRGESPDGSKMKPVNRSVVRKGKVHAGIPLKDTGVNLKASITFSSGINDVTVGSNFVGARVHQEGYPEKNIPARPYLGISEDDKEKIKDAIPAYYFKGEIGKGEK